MNRVWRTITDALKPRVSDSPSVPTTDGAGDPHPHFNELRSRINHRLGELRPPNWTEQQQTAWLYGALGAVPVGVMFICENPSLTPIRRIKTIDGGPPDIEAQWWGSPRNPAAKRFRHALRETGLKTTAPGERGGWRCYITNVVKEANYATSEQRRLSAPERRQQGEAWADILNWELAQVQPRHLICVGDKSYEIVSHLRDQKLLDGRPPRIHQIVHYSARGKGCTDEAVRRRMIDGIQTAIDRS